MKRNSTTIKALRLERSYWLRIARQERRWMKLSIAKAKEINREIIRLQKEIKKGKKS